MPDRFLVVPEPHPGSRGTQKLSRTNMTWQLIPETHHSLKKVPPTLCPGSSSTQLLMPIGSDLCAGFEYVQFSQPNFIAHTLEVLGLV